MKVATPRLLRLADGQEAELMEARGACFAFLKTRSRYRPRRHVTEASAFAPFVLSGRATSKYAHRTKRVVFGWPRDGLAPVCAIQSWCGEITTTTQLGHDSLGREVCPRCEFNEQQARA